MLLPVLLAAAGGLAGAVAAHRRKGTGFDVAQWAAVWALMGLILGVLATVILLRAA